MKNLVCVLIAALLLLGACAFAETAYVSNSNGQGELVMTREAVELTDADADGVITIADALTIAHENAYEGGAAEGILVEDQGYGLCIVKLWGEENGGSYGFYVNDASSLNLGDAVADGDHVKAYAYTDLTAWSDVYSYFQSSCTEIAAGEELPISLTALIYDADWNQDATPVEGAVITINGVDSEAVTNADGSASVSFSEAGEYIISAHSETMTLVPPVCVVSVS